jgi:hypothetical protein
MEQAKPRVSGSLMSRYDFQVNSSTNLYFLPLKFTYISVSEITSIAVGMTESIAIFALCTSTFTLTLQQALLMS